MRNLLKPVLKQWLKSKVSSKIKPSYINCSWNDPNHTSLWHLIVQNTSRLDEVCLERKACISPSTSYMYWTQKRNISPTIQVESHPEQNRQSFQGGGTWYIDKILMATKRSVAHIKKGYIVLSEFRTKIKSLLKVFILIQFRRSRNR